jgi:hypothetical protein
MYYWMLRPNFTYAPHTLAQFAAHTTPTRLQRRRILAKLAKCHYLLTPCFLRAEHFLTLVSYALEQPDAPVTHLPLMSKWESNQVSG